MLKPPAGTLIKPGHFDAQGLVAAWPFNTGFGGALYDYAPGKPWLERNHGTLGGPIWVPGRDGAVLSFNGISDYVDCGRDNVLNITGDLAIVAWINSDLVGRQFVIVRANSSGSTGYGISINRVDDDITLTFFGVAHYTSTNSVLLPNVWHQMIVVHNNSANTIDFYVDGAFVNQLTGVGGIISASDEEACMGTAQNKAGLWFDGRIGSVLIYNRVLSAAEVMQMYLNPYAVFQQQQVSPWFVVSAVGAPVPVFMWHYRNMRMN